MSKAAGPWGTGSYEIGPRGTDGDGDLGYGRPRSAPTLAAVEAAGGRIWRIFPRRSARAAAAGLIYYTQRFDPTAGEGVCGYGRPAERPWDEQGDRGPLERGYGPRASGFGPRANGYGNPFDPAFLPPDSRRPECWPRPGHSDGWGLATPESERATLPR